MDDLMQYTTAAFRNWSNFSGRARRKGFWMFYLGVVIAFVVLGLVTALLPRIGALLTRLPGLAVVVPFLSVSIRRLHDTGRSGWWYLLTIVPLGGLVLLYFFVQDIQRGTNEYGPNPKALVFAYA